MKRLGLLAAAACLLAACGGGEEEGGISRRKFLAANVAFRSVPDTVAGAERFRADSLKRHRVTEKELRTFVSAHLDDPEYMALLWKEIADSLDRRWDAEMARNPPPPPPNRPEEPPLAPGQELTPVPSPGRVRPDTAGFVPPPRPSGRGRVKRLNEAVRPRVRPPGEPPADTRPWVPERRDSFRIAPPPPPGT
ncbi:MAG TPA: hypothetical protein VHG91_15625 [Longimicrobium sp.]|nr:hypothetical protein [Longimicrobium sp.]